MRFKAFLEAQVKPYESQALKLDELIKQLRVHCGESLAAGQKNEEAQLWRGTKKKSPSGIYHPGTGVRASQNTTNQYTQLLDSNPLNEGWPKRANSFICTTRRPTALGYSLNRSGENGEVYAVFPFDSTQVGVCNINDIWNTKVIFKATDLVTDSLVSWNETWNDLENSLNKKFSFNLKELQAELKKVDPKDFCVTLLERDLLNRFPADSTELLSSFIKELPEAYSYKRLGCELKVAGGVAHAKSEVWMSDPVILVTQADWLAVAKEFKL